MRERTEEEERVINKLAHLRTISARLVKQAQIIELVKEEVMIPQIKQQIYLSEHQVQR
jgi:hypothetical protein